MKHLLCKLDRIDGIQIIRGIPSSQAGPKGTIPVKAMHEIRGPQPPDTFVDLESLGHRKNCLVQPGDVLQSLAWSEIEDDTYVVTESDEPFVPAHSFAIVRTAQSDVLNPWFLAAWFSSDQGRELLPAKFNEGFGIGFDEFKAMSVPLPPMDVQSLIADRFERLVTSANLHRAVLEDVEYLMGAEMTVAFDDLGAEEVDD